MKLFFYAWTKLSSQPERLVHQGQAKPDYKTCKQNLSLQGWNSSPKKHATTDEFLSTKLSQTFGLPMNFDDELCFDVSGFQPVRISSTSIFNFTNHKNTQTSIALRTSSHTKFFFFTTQALRAQSFTKCFLCPSCLSVFPFFNHLVFLSVSACPECLSGKLLLKVI